MRLVDPIYVAESVEKALKNPGQPVAPTLPLILPPPLMLLPPSSMLLLVLLSRSNVTNAERVLLLWRPVSPNPSFANRPRTRPRRVLDGSLQSGVPHRRVGSEWRLLAGETLSACAACAASCVLLSTTTPSVGRRTVC